MEIMLAVLGLSASFFFAGSEAAFTAFNKIRLDIWQKQQKQFVSSALFFHEKPEAFFSTILIGNNFALTLYTTFAAVWLVQWFDESTAGILLALVVLFIGEIFPKTLFRSLADKVILKTLILVQLFYWLFKPLISALNLFIDLFLKLIGVQHQSVKNYFSRDELQLLLHTGIGKNDQQKYIANVLQFKEVKVREAMIPRTEMTAVEHSAGWDAVFEALMESGDPFVLLYSDSIDNITGAVFAYELLRPERAVEEICRPLRYVPENKSCARLLREFQNEKITLAVVVDEYGGTAGVITMDDLVEEVFGEAEPEGGIKALNDHTWLLDARTEIDMLEEMLDLPEIQTEAETIAGLILEKSGSIPAEGEQFKFNRFRIEIVRASSNRIIQVKLIRYLNKTE